MTQKIVSYFSTIGKVITLSILLYACSKGPEPAPIPIETLPVIENQGNRALFRAVMPDVSTNVNGFLVGTSPKPTLENARHIAAGTPINDTIEAYVDLEPSTPAFYLRAYAFVDDEINYGNEIQFATGYAIGQAYGGGRVAYLLGPDDPGFDPTTEHGLIIADDLFGTDLIWSCDSIYVDDGQGFDVGTGAANTVGIVSTCGLPSSAAAYCSNYTAGGFNDWHLPSFSELQKIDSNFDILGDIEGGHYWSSTQSPDTLKAWAIFMWTNTEPEPFPSGEYLKSAGRKAIAVRSF